MKVSFDFDGTILGFDGKDIESTHAKLKQHIADGDIVMIITKRNPGELHSGVDVSAYMKEKFDGFDIPIFYTNHQLKYQSLLNHEIDKHYDDDPEELKAITDNTAIETELISDDNSAQHQEYMASRVNESYIKKLNFNKGRLPAFEDYYNGLNHELDMGNMNDINNMNRSMGADVDGNL